MSDEYIKKGPLMKFIEDGLNNPNPEKAFGHDAIEIMTEIKFTPAAPVREVVTCGECKYRERCSIKDNMDVSRRILGIKEDGFCAIGKRAVMRGGEGGPT